MSATADIGVGEGMPLACTLAANDGRSRMLRWQRLHERAATVAHLAGGQLEVFYQPGAGIEDELVALADAESKCCSFVTWSVTSSGGQPVLRVTAPTETPDAVMPIAALFGAGARSVHDRRPATRPGPSHEGA